MSSAMTVLIVNDDPVSSAHLSALARAGEWVSDADGARERSRAPFVFGGDGMGVATGRQLWKCRDSQASNRARARADFR